MDTAELIRLVRELTPEALADLVDSLSHDEVIALSELVPRTEVREDPAFQGPAELARKVEPTYRAPTHVQLLSDAIRQTVEESLAGTGTGRLIVSMPPRVGKSYTTSLWTPVWFLERYPHKHVILASHDANFAVSWGRKVRDTHIRLASQGVTQARVSRTVSAASEWETTQGGGMLSRGIGGSITGRGAHCLVIDDPLKDFAQAHSSAIRQSQWDWWTSTASTRLEPGAVVIVVATRWHEDDLIGRLLSTEHEGDPDEWRVIRIPALGEGVVEDVTTGVVPPDALDRDEGVPLTLASTDETPAAAAARWDRIRVQVGSYIWNGMYQQRPSEPEGAILKRGWWQFYHRDGTTLRRPDGSTVDITDLRIVQSWDMSFKDRKTSDYVVGQVWGALGQGDRFLLDQVHERLDFVATKRAMKRFRARWPQTTATWVEDTANGPAIIAELKRDLSGLIPVSPKGSKEARAWSIQGDLEAGNLWLPTPHPETAPWVGRFIQEAADFPNGAHDDQVDALTQAIERLRTSRAEVFTVSGSRQDGAVRSLPTTRRTISRANYG